MCFIKWVGFSQPYWKTSPSLTKIQIRTDFLYGRTCPLIPSGCFRSPNTSKWRSRTKPSTAQDWSNNPHIAKEKPPTSVLKLFRTNTGSISFGSAFLKLASVDANSGRSPKKQVPISATKTEDLLERTNYMIEHVQLCTPLKHPMCTWNLRTHLFWTHIWYVLVIFVFK